MAGGDPVALDADSVTITRADLESLQDRLYVLRNALEILRDTLAEDAGAAELRHVAAEVVAAGGDLDRLWVSP